MAGFLQGKRIFMVEDTTENRAIAQIILEQQGAKVGFERWGRDTLARLRAFMPVDLILLDLMLPNNVTGYDLFTLIRAEPEFDGIPIAAFSAADPYTAIPKTKAHGFDGYISKPLNFTQFAGQVAMLIRRENVWIAR
jgi:two-component system cell cycle response regulator DivK